MRSMLRQFRRAPGRIIASVFALALAVGAIGVLAVPTVSTGTLHETAERDGLADIVVPTSPLDADQLARIETIDNVTAAEVQASLAVETADGFLTALIGVDFDAQTMVIVQVADVRLPVAVDVVVTSPAVGALGDTVVGNGGP